MRAFIFPGQGSQSVGMGQGLAAASRAARELFQEVDEALGQNLFRLMCEGPGDELVLTENAQPAIMANSLAAMRVLERDGGFRLADKADYVAGHSLGEYTALCAAEALGVSETARLLRIRGAAMQAAVPVGKGAMAALLGLDFAAVTQIAADAAETDVCEAANDNAPGQVVISGDKAAVERAVELAKVRGGKRAMLLNVSAPFHCSLMEPAAQTMEKALVKADLRGPLIPLYANVTAAPVADPSAIRVLLVEQVTGTVRWRESVEAMAAAGVTEFVEFGAKALGPMIKRIAPDTLATSVITMADIEALAKTL